MDDVGRVESQRRESDLHFFSDLDLQLATYVRLHFHFGQIDATADIFSNAIRYYKMNNGL